jgi:hypothetical protein
MKQYLNTYHLKNALYFFSIVVTLMAMPSCNKQKQTDWSTTLRKQDKIPFGTILSYGLLEKMYPKAKLTSAQTIFSKKEIIDLYDDDNDTNCKFIIAQSLVFSTSEEENIKQFVKTGNTLFVSSTNIDLDFLSKIGVKFYSDELESNTLKNKDSIAQTFAMAQINGGNKTTINYNYIGPDICNILETDSTNMYHVQSIGYDEKGFTNCVKVHYGKGLIFINAAPIVMTNHFLIQNNNYEYLTRLYSYLPKNIKAIQWHQFRNRTHGDDGNKKNENNLFNLELLNKYPMWKIAIFLAIFGVILFVLSNMRRRQREIPIVPPVTNNSMAFVETVGQLYFNKQNHLNIAEKMIAHFLENVKTKYNIATNKLDENFTKVLSSKSDKPFSEVDSLIKNIITIKQMGCDAYDLERLYKQIQNFNK